MKRIYPFTFYLVYYAAGVFIQPNVILYFQKLNFSGAQIGLLAGITPLIALLGAPLLTGLADSSNRHKLVMGVSILMSVISAAIFPAVRIFAWMIPLVVLYAFFAAPVASFADSATMSMLGEEKQMYGRVRLGGTIGWGLVALVAGPVIGKYGIQWAFWGSSAIMIFGLFISLKFSYAQKPKQETLLGDVRAVFADRRWGIFLAMAFMGGIAFMVVNSFLFPYMDELHINNTTMNIALTIATVSELPILFFANRLLQRFKAYGLLVGAIVITGLRLLLYAGVSSQTGILAFQLLNGMTYPLFWVAGVSYANEISPEGMKSTAQGLFGAMVFGFGAAAGGLASGLLMDGLGGRGLFLIAGIFTLLSVLVIYLIGRRQQARQLRTLG